MLERWRKVQGDREDNRTPNEVFFGRARIILGISMA